MTKVQFFEQGGRLTGFSLSGHSSADANDETGKLVCAAVSSAAYFAANTITDVIGAKASVSVTDAAMRLRVQNPDPRTDAVLAGLKLHLEQLSAQYESKIKLTTEV